MNAAQARLMVVDDDATLATQVMLGARALGFAAVSSQDPMLLDSRTLANLDVVVLDLLMPSLDGVEFLRSLKNSDETARSPALILMSGLDRRTLESARQTAQALGLAVLGVLKKPFGLDDLREMLNRYAPQPLQTAVVSNAKTHLSGCTEEDLVAALHSGEIVPYFQPQVSVANGAWTGLEALARWKHPVHGLLSAETFIRHVDAEDVALPFARAFIDCAMRHFVEICRNTGFRGSLSINVSAAALGHYTLAEHIFKSLESAQLVGSRLILEITETAMARNESVTLDVLTRLRMRGVRMSIDDFGTGQSGLDRLREMPCDELKLDRVFVSDAETNATSRSIAENAIQLGHRLGMTVVAEGIENGSTLDWLRSSGCDIAQGYWIATPLSPTDVESWARARSSDGRTTSKIEEHGREASGGDST
jgi:EAL domain-containing protein (putative c-di-GMP-specific phosphodiesterase class I)/CheY-like chemotaxis protein